MANRGRPQIPDSLKKTNRKLGEAIPDAVKAVPLESQVITTRTKQVQQQTTNSLEVSTFRFKNIEGTCSICGKSLDPEKEKGTLVNELGRAAHTLCLLDKTLEKCQGNCDKAALITAIDKKVFLARIKSKQNPKNKKF